MRAPIRFSDAPARPAVPAPARPLPAAAPVPSLLAGPTAKARAIADSDMAASISGFDWGATPLGPSDGWPQGLKAAVRLLLGSRLPMVIGWGPQLVALYNDAFSDLLGDRHPWALGRSLRETWAEAWPALGPRFESVLREGTASAEPAQLVLQRQGRPVDVAVTVASSPCFNDQGEVGGVFCVCTEDTAGQPEATASPSHAAAAAATAAPDTALQEAAQREQALRASERHFREMAEAMPQIVYVLGPEGRVAYINRQWAGYTGQEGTDREHLVTVVHPDDQPALERLWRLGTALGEPVTAEIRLKGADGHWRWFLTRAVPVHDDAGRVVRWYGTATDVDASHRNAEALAQAHAALQQVERRKDQFIATLAHELRNPLAPLRNGVQLLALGGGPEGGARVQAMMRRQIDHLVRLVDDLLEVSRITSGKVVLQRGRVDLAEVLHAAADTVRPILDTARHTLHVDVDPLLGQTVDGDGMRLGQVFTNLLNNAAKYTEPGGRLVLRGRREGNQAVVQVQDDGLGLAPDMLEEVFQPFVQVDRSASRAQGGLGIGLSIVRSLVELHGGRVRAHSAGDGQGSTFEVCLPLETPADLQDDADAAGRGQAGKSAATSVLVVDDNHDAADSLAYMLEMMGARARVVYGGPDALAAAEAEAPALVLLDIGMPGMDGYEVARRLAAHPQRHRMLLVALTGWGQAEDRQRTRDAGFDEHLVKPAEIDALEALVARAALQG